LVRLPNYARLIRELRLLERRTQRSGKDTVEHPRNGHDDYANVVCGVLSLLAPPAFEQPNELASPIIVSGGAITPPVGRAEWNHRMVNNMKRRKQKANTSKPASSPPLNAPAPALSGDETKRRMALVNADREIVRKIMTEPGPRWEPQSPPRAENAANFFRWAANAPFEQGAVGDLR